MPGALPLSHILLFAAIPALTMSVGGVLSTLWIPGRRMQSLIQHFAAGVVFAVVAGELLPDFVHEHSIWIVALGFSAGVALMLALRLLPGGAPPDHLTVGSGEHVEPATVRKSRGILGSLRRGGALGLLIPIGIDALLDGVLIGIGFTAASRVGVLLTLALAVEMFSMGLALATTLYGIAVGARAEKPSAAERTRVERRASASGAVLTVGIAMLIVIGAAGGATALARLSTHALAGVLAFAAAALLFLVTEELLVRAHENAETTIATAMFFVGFLAFLLLGMTGA